MAHESTVETQTGRSPETVDRLMVGVCGAIWLVLLAASVFATVALVRLATGHAGGGERQSSWLLYSIIVISALVILGAIPLLLRARRSALTPDARADTGDEASAGSPAVPVRKPEAPTEKMRVFGVDPYASRELAAGSSAARHAYHAMVDRVWLRGTTSLLGVMGLALTGVAVGTYLLAVASDTAAWVAFGTAGALAISMIAVLAFFQRQLGEVVEAGE